MQSQLTGQIFGRWTVSEQDGVDKDGSTKWLCECQCGIIRVVSGHSLKRGRSSSCGCLKIDKITTHGLHKTPTYRIWTGIKRRCTNPNAKDYPCYGGRGITVCDRWMHSFENFLSDMGVRPEGLQIDRIDNEKGYSKENCRWVTAKVNCNNRRCNRIEYNGNNLTVAEWSDRLNITTGTLRKRLKSGWSIDKIMNTGLGETKAGRYSNFKKEVANETIVAAGPGIDRIV